MHLLIKLTIDFTTTLKARKQTNEKKTYINGRQINYN